LEDAAYSQSRQREVQLDILGC